MAFGGVFHAAFRPVFDPGGAAAVAPPAYWWQAGGAPTPIAVYQPKGAASLAASYSNLITPGTYDAAPGTEPSWDAGTGWSFNGVNDYLVTGAVPVMGTWTVLVLYDVDEYEAERRDIFGVTEGLLQKFGIHIEAGSTFFENGDSLEAVGVPALSAVIGFSGSTALLDGVVVGTIPAGSGAFIGDIEVGRGLVGGMTWER